MPWIVITFSALNLDRSSCRTQIVITSLVISSLLPTVSPLLLLGHIHYAKVHDSDFNFGTIAFCLAFPVG